MKQSFLLCAIALLPLAAQADLGPKPTAYFRWKEKGEVDLKSVKLLQCEDSECKKSSPLGDAGPQHFACCADGKGCGALAYGFSATSQISATRKGKPLLSQPFVSPKTEGFYELSVEAGKIATKAVNPFSEEEGRALLNCRHH